MKNVRKKIILLSLLFLTLFLAGVPASAAKYKSQWRLSSGRYYYYNAKGKKVTGITKIRNKQYYFDEKGIQRTGWQLIGKNYYYFKIGEAKKGSMVTDKTVNGVRLDKKGKAVLTKDSKEKLKLMVHASEVVEEITDWSMSKMERLRKCFDYTKHTYHYYNWRKFSNVKNWDKLYASDMFFHGKGNCFSYAAAFAYLANAVGYSANVISSGGHGWAEIDGRVFDPDWALASRVDSYFNMSYSLSGRGGRPNYKPNRAYVVKV